MPWIRRKTTITGFVLLALIAWSLAANEWINRNCGTAQSYGLVIEHFGTPGEKQGCEDEPGGPAYTTDYSG